MSEVGSVGRSYSEQLTLLHGGNGGQMAFVEGYIHVLILSVDYNLEFYVRKQETTSGSFSHFTDKEPET